MSTHTLTLGPLVLVGKQVAHLIDVDIFAGGISVGSMQLTLPTWTGLVCLADVLAAADKEMARLRAENERLTACLKRANDNHETFERLWYMTQDERDQLRAECHGRRFDPNMQPILSVLGDWDWSGLAADWPLADERALEAVVKAMAAVERSVAKEQP